METKEKITVRKSGAQSDRIPPTKEETNRRPAGNRSRINPRIVYADPESYFNTMFHDLLMEQSEQG